jgi:hypothetical protein
MSRTTIRKSAVNALAGKLEAFGSSLSTQEQNVLGWILARANETDRADLSDSDLEQVAGGQGIPLARQLADSVGFSGVESAGESEISVAWKYSFQ